MEQVRDHEISGKDRKQQGALRKTTPLVLEDKNTSHIHDATVSSFWPSLFVIESQGYK
jgi:hypothetical protein